MCGFCGYVNKKGYIVDDKQIRDMTDTLIKRGPNDYNVYFKNNVALGHTRLSIIDVKFGTQPMSKQIDDNKYIIVYNGELYNTQELRNDLTKKGYTFSTKCDTEVILTSYIEYGKNCISSFNGIFAFAIYDVNNNQVFLGRDRLGIKPLFYTFTESNFVFGSEIKSLLANRDVKPILDKSGLMELFGLGPSHTPGSTFFKNIFEIKPGFYGILKDFKLITEQYWDLKTCENNDTESIAIEKIHFLLNDATKRQLVSDVGICSMLSGGLDSSILTKIAKDNLKDLCTFSVDFEGNDTDFKPNTYQSSKDSDFVKIMKDYLQTNHKTVVLNNLDTFNLLKEALIARDMPGMADIDTSMLGFCKNINKAGFKVCLSGECSDEIFGGYPWFYREHLMNHKEGFPWALSENLRNDLLKKDILNKNELFEYISSSKKKMLENVNFLENENNFERKYREINYLTIKFFMTTLLERTDRMSMSSSLEVRVPFADHRIFEYVYNLPANLKLGLFNNKVPVEKFLLRKAYENELPNEIVYRKKSPFPKTYDPDYLKLVERTMLNTLNNKSLKIHKIINSEFIFNLIQNHGKGLTENLFGQLMTYPQTLAFLYQISLWLELYNIEIEI